VTAMMHIFMKARELGVVNDPGLVFSEVEFCLVDASSLRLF